MVVEFRLLGVLEVLTVLTCVLLYADGKPVELLPKKSTRFLSTLSMDNKKERRIICHYLCSEPDSFCPPSCPEHMFSSLSGMMKRDPDRDSPSTESGKQGVGSAASPKDKIPNPFDADLGSLNLEDYLFLKAVGKI